MSRSSTGLVRDLRFKVFQLRREAPRPSESLVSYITSGCHNLKMEALRHSEILIIQHIIGGRDNLKMEAAWSFEMSISYITTRHHNLKMEARRTFESLVSYITTGCHNPEDHDLCYGVVASIA